MQSRHGPRPESFQQGHQTIQDPSFKYIRPLSGARYFQTFAAPDARSAVCWFSTLQRAEVQWPAYNHSHRICNGMRVISCVKASSSWTTFLGRRNAHRFWPSARQASSPIHPEPAGHGSRLHGAAAAEVRTFPETSFKSGYQQWVPATARFRRTFSVSKSLSRFAWSSKPPYSFAPSVIRVSRHANRMNRLLLCLPLWDHHFLTSRSFDNLLRSVCFLPMAFSNKCQSYV